MAGPRILKVKAVWDSEASVWCATSRDIPGLVTEAETEELLLQKLRVMIPQLLKLNGLTGTFRQDRAVQVSVVSERLVRVPVPAHKPWRAKNGMCGLSYGSMAAGWSARARAITKSGSARSPSGTSPSMPESSRDIPPKPS